MARHNFRRLRSPALALLPLVILLAACGDDDSLPLDDPRTIRITSTIQRLTQLWHDRGAAEMYPEASLQVQGACTQEQFAAALSGREAPVAYARTNSLKFEDRSVRAKVVLLTPEGEREEEWTLLELPNGTWRLHALPGLTGCE